MSSILKSGFDESDKKKKRVNFSPSELECVKGLVLKHPIIEQKIHDKKSENMKKSSWDSIWKEFNSNPMNSCRSLDQIKNAWKRLKQQYKAQKAAERRSKFKTGGGPPSPPHETLDSDDERDMDEMMTDQKPLDNIPDDDHMSDIIHSEDVMELHDLTLPSTSTSNTRRLGNRLVTTKPISSPSPVTKSATKKVTSFAQEFHKKRMEFLEEEHKMKMEVLMAEKNYWRVKTEMIVHNDEREKITHQFPSTEETTISLLSDIMTN